jgi:hypothetical protein
MRRVKAEEGGRKKLLKTRWKGRHGYYETDEEKRIEYKLTPFKRKHTREGHIAECSKAVTDSTTHLRPPPQFHPLMYLIANKITKVRISDYESVYP